MAEAFFPRFSIAAHWMSSSEIFCVQLIEIAESPYEQLLGGRFAIRVSMIDKDGGAAVAFTLSRGAEQEFIELLYKAVEKREQLEGKAQ